MIGYPSFNMLTFPINMLKKAKEKCIVYMYMYFHCINHVNCSWTKLHNFHNSFIEEVPINCRPLNCCKLNSNPSARRAPIVQPTAQFSNTC